MTHLTPINCAEAIFEPFFDPQLSDLDAWENQNDEIGVILAVYPSNQATA